MKLLRLTRWRVFVAMHAAQGLALVIMVIPMTAKLLSELVSGDAPSWSALLLVLIGVPGILACLIAVGVVVWLRSDVRGPLIAVDALVTIGAWLFSVPFLFSTQIPLLLFVLAPACLLVALLAPPAQPIRPGPDGDP